MHDSRNDSLLWVICLILFGLLLAAALFLVPSRLPDSSVRDLSGRVPTLSETPVPSVVPAPSNSPEHIVIPVESASPKADELPADAAVPEVTTLPPTSEPPTEEPDSATIMVDVVVTSEPEPTPEPIHVHTYKDGVCTGCGAKPEFYTDFLPDEFYQESEHPGKVVSYDYTCAAYANHNYGEYEKTCSVYLPYGYDESKQYNVLVLLHETGGDQNSWLTEVHDYGEIQISGKAIFDRMFELGCCEPCIIVCPAYEDRYIQGLTAGIYQMRDELREDILPYIVEHYSTYAKDSSLKSLQEAREHFGLGGASTGALITFEGGMRYNFDIFGSYIALSGDGEPWLTVSIIQEEQYAELPVTCLFTGAGTHGDWAQSYTLDGYRYFMERDDRFHEGKNIWNVDVEGQHEWKVWLTDAVNGIPLMF